VIFPQYFDVYKKAPWVSCAASRKTQRLFHFQIMVLLEPIEYL